MITTWHILIAGFTQNHGRLSGMEQLWRQFRIFSGLRTSVQYKLWDDNWPQFAEFIFRNVQHQSTVAEADVVVDKPIMLPAGSKLFHLVPTPPRICVYAYSWGAGHGAMTLARELLKRGLAVDAMVLCDPVYRSPWLPTWLPINPLSMLTIPRIEVPANVRLVRWCRQRLNRPAGHDLIAADPRNTKIDEATVLRAAHEYMDDQAAFHAMAYSVARSAAA